MTEDFCFTIGDLSQILRAILIKHKNDFKLLHPLELADTPEPAEIDIVFTRPDDKFSPTRTTVDLFLYDIHENIELRSNECRIEHQNGKTITYPPPLRVACSYLITAWPVGGQDISLQEHLLLSQILKVLSQYSTISDDSLADILTEKELPLPKLLLPIVVQIGDFKNPAEFWTALGNKIRPSITVTATIALETFSPREEWTVITKKIALGQRTFPEEEKILPATKEELFSIGGQITSNNIPKGDVTVTLVELGIITQTDADGHYILSPINPGTYTLQVQSGGALLKESKIIVPVSEETANKNYDVEC